jgi:ferritin-like metal-binding protein YciE
MQYDSPQDVFADQLADLWSAERQLVTALPEVVDAVSSDKLGDAVEEHLAETRGHGARLERIIGNLELAYPNEECEAMQGLLREGERVMPTGGDPVARDVALVAAASASSTTRSPPTAPCGPSRTSSGSARSARSCARRSTRSTTPTRR